MTASCKSFFLVLLLESALRVGASNGRCSDVATRAALNENFARELPLEYRAILKDYYERLTK